MTKARSLHSSRSTASLQDMLTGNNNNNANNNANSSNRQAALPITEVFPQSSPPSFLQPITTATTVTSTSNEPPYNPPSHYTNPFITFISQNPTVFHTISHFESLLKSSGFQELSERAPWTDLLVRGGKYFVTRNGSSLIAFIVGKEYKAGPSGFAMIAGHVDALAARLKPVSKKRSVEGYEMLGVAPYAGALNSTWFDRDLGVGGKVIVREKGSGKVVSRVVKLDWPIARIPTLAPHFGEAARGPFNKETQMVPVVGLESGAEDEDEVEKEWKGRIEKGSFLEGQNSRLGYLIGKALGVENPGEILSWELELFDTQPATVGGLKKEFIFAPRIDDKLCSWAALYALLEASKLEKVVGNSSVSLAAFFDDEEIGSRLRQGAMGNFLPGTVERIVDAFAFCSSSAASTSISSNAVGGGSVGGGSAAGAHSLNLVQQTYASSFLISADVIHAVNPNFTSAYLPSHMPKLNTGLVISCDPNGHMTTDAVSTVFLGLVAEKMEPRHTLQVFQIRNDSRSGGTVGPMLSAKMGVRAIDAGLAQLSMHSIRATTGSLEPGLGVGIFRAFYEFFEEVDAVMQGA